MPKSENFLYFPRQDMVGRCFHFGVFEFFVSSLTFLAIGGFTLRKFGGAKLLITKDACRVVQPGLCFCTLGRKPLANMLIYIGDGIRDSFKNRKMMRYGKKRFIRHFE